MTLTSTPDLPTIQYQNPAISGCKLGWTSCTSFGIAMLLDVVFFGQRIPKGCTIRTYTGDTVGGTTLPQNARVAKDHYGVTLEVHVGSNVIRPTALAKQVRAGRPASIQIGTRPLLSHPGYRSTRGPINHDVDILKVRGGTAEVPREAYWYDPAADGRTAGWGKASKGPKWIPWSLALQCMAALQPWGEDDSRTVGIGKVYVALTPPPRVTFRYGGTPTVPFPDSQHVKSPIAGRSANVRSRPTSMSSAYVVDQIPDGKRFVAYQKAHGVKPAGSSSDVWYADWTGTRWIHSSNLTDKGGAG